MSAFSKMKVLSLSTPYCNSVSELKNMLSFVCPLPCTSPPGFVLLYPCQGPENHERNRVQSSSEVMIFELRTAQLEFVQEIPGNSKKMQQAEESTQPKNRGSREKQSGSDLRGEQTAPLRSCSQASGDSSKERGGSTGW